MSSDKRNALRAALIGQKHKANSETVTLFGQEIELRQPTLGTILKARDEADERTRTTDVFLQYAYVPGTEELVFEEGDRDTILNWPFSEELLAIQLVIAKLTGIDISNEEEALKTDPLEDSSSDTQ